MNHRTAILGAFTGLFLAACRPASDDGSPGVAPPPAPTAPPTPAPEVAEETPATEPLVLWVTRAADDEDEGSLRQRLAEAARHEGPTTLRFDATDGPFSDPQTITLTRPLPPLPDGLVVDGRIEGQLWKATGVTVQAGGEYPIFQVPAGATVTLQSLTLGNGSAPRGGGVVSAGSLVVRGTTFVGNRATEAGGGIANEGGTLVVINSTFADNTAGSRGGGVANLSGTATLTNCTFTGNSAPLGTALASDAPVLVTNTIMANGVGELDCVVDAGVDPASRANIITTHRGCGDPLARNPKLGALGLYNGPTPTVPLGGGSPAINLGDNSAAVDEQGDPLRWDQRGNGDPRFVAGIVDIGAFERQAFPDFVVDTPEDVDLRACTAVRGDCSLRGAWVLAAATPEADRITFDEQTFRDEAPLTLTHPLPPAEAPVTVDASAIGGITLRGPLGKDGDPNAEWIAVTREDPSAPPPAP